jgi:hypothetical protein
MKNRSLFTLIFAISTLTPVCLAHAGPAKGDVYQDVFNQVSQSNLQKLMNDMTGSNTVTVDSKVFAITDRYLP